MLVCMHLDPSFCLRLVSEKVISWAGDIESKIADEWGCCYCVVDAASIVDTTVALTPRALLSVDPCWFLHR